MVPSWHLGNSTVLNKGKGKNKVLDEAGSHFIVHNSTVLDKEKGEDKKKVLGEAGSHFVVHNNGNSTVLDKSKSKDKNRDKVLDEAGSHFVVHNNRYNRRHVNFLEVVHKRRYVTNSR